MKIVQVVTLVSSRGAFGGPTTVALAQSRELRRVGHDVVLIGLHDAEESAGTTTEVEGVPVRLSRARQLVPRMGLLGQFNPALLIELWRQIGRADVVHIHTGRDLVSIVALAIARVRRRPYLTQTHGMVEPRAAAVARVFDVVLRPLLRGAEERFVLTDLESAALAEVVPGAETTRLANGVPIPALTEGAQRGDPPAVVFLARLHPRKRVLVFADVARRLSERGITAELVAYGPDEGDLAQLRDRIDALPADSSARLSYGGALDHEAAVATLAAADVYVLPSVNEVYPMTLLEAMSHGTPVVFTDSCGLAGVLAGRSGAVVTDGSADQIAAAVADLIATDEGWQEAARGAYATAEECFSVRAVGGSLVTAYQKALA